MKCSLLTLSCALDGELSRERQLELDAHLITCDRCKTGMRYLRDETERISLLAPVRLPGATATALLERSRVLVGAPASADEQSPSGEGPADQEVSPRSAPDPFGAIGIGSAILDLPLASEPLAVPLDDAPEDAPPALQRGSSFEAEEADRSDAEALAPVPEDLWLAEGPEEVAPPAEDAEPVAPPADEPTRDEVAIPETVFAEDNLSQDPAPEPAPAEEEALGGPAWDSPHPVVAEPIVPDPEDEVPAEAAAGDPALVEDADSRPSSIVVPGWEPATELKMPWTDIPLARPAADTWAPDLSPAEKVPGERASVPPVTPFAAPPPPTRPAAAAVPGLQADRKLEAVTGSVPRRGPSGGSRRPVRPAPAGNQPEPRSWTRTGLIAVAALAVVLIGWNLTHGSSPASVNHPKGQATPIVSTQPSPSGGASPAATPSPLALTNSQTVGGGGGGYQLQTVRYGVHGSQFWVV
ncbi:MAG TPA: zf-HC2 domain-containing protein, partial [Candidatus Dormibacteraeota bacterium]